VVQKTNINLRNASQSSIHRFLQLLEVVVQGRQRRNREEPLVDYSKSIMLTSEQYLQSMEVKAERRKESRIAEKL
jgi:hypothetical protein